MATANLTVLMLLHIFLQLVPVVDHVVTIELKFYDRGILVPSFVGVGYSIRRQQAVEVADLWQAVHRPYVSLHQPHVNLHWPYVRVLLPTNFFPFFEKNLVFLALGFRGFGFRV